MWALRRQTVEVGRVLGFAFLAGREAEGWLGLSSARKVRDLGGEEDILI